MGPGDKKFSAEFLKKATEDALDAAELAHHTPDALQLIDDRAKELLFKIRDKVNEIGPKTFDEIVAAPAGPGHEAFKNIWGTDASSINATFIEANEETGELPAEFYAPIIGRHEYLEHILTCSYCLYALTAEKTIDIPLDAELNRRGYKIKESRKGKTFKDEVDFPKEN